MKVYFINTSAPRYATSYLKLTKPVLVVINAILGFCFIITGIIYSRMYYTARHHANQIQVPQIQVAQNSQIESDARKRKSAISMFYVYLVFSVCYLPHYCVRVAFAYFIKSPPSTTLDGGYLYLMTLVFLNSCLNPVMYQSIPKPPIPPPGNPRAFDSR